MIARRIVLLTALITAAFFSHAQKRFKDPVFNTVDSIADVVYGEAINLKGEKEKLLLNAYFPAGDTSTKRPLVIFIHGGGFQNNNRFGGYSARVCNGFTKRGYVTASIEYRLGIEGSKTNRDYLEALYRAQQDGRAAVRFFRRYAAKYGIDTSQIFVAGSSAGSMTALAMAYWKPGNVSADIDQRRWGSLEGNSGNEGFSSRVHGVINSWGALPDYRWIQQGDAPVFNISGTADKTVPFDSSYNYHGFHDGGYILYQRCLQEGIPTGWRPFVNAGHTLDNNKEKQDSAIQSMTVWLYTQLNVIYKGSLQREPVFRWESEMKTFDSLNRIEKHGKNALLFMGSSSIRYWDRIREDLQQSDIIHRGYGGSNMTDLAYYVKRIVFPHQPKAIFMYVANDLANTEKDKEPDQVLELFKYTVKTIREKYPVTPIIWIFISPNQSRWNVWPQVQETNRLIEEYCNSQKNLFTINVGANYLGAGGKPIPSYYRADQLHFSEEGYRVWGKAMREAVARIAAN
jgi:lysophospholipase L1-like esterase